MSSQAHDKGIEAAENSLREQGYTLMPTPTIGGFIPDVYGEKAKAKFIQRAVVEVETDASIGHEHSIEQVKAVLPLIRIA